MAPTPEQKAKQKAKEEAQKAKARSLKNRKQSYINLLISLGLNPGDYRKIIEQAAKNDWGDETFLKRAGLQSAAVTADAEEGFLAQVLADYQDTYGTPAPKALVDQLMKLGPEQLAEYNTKLQKVLEQKLAKEETRGTYVAQLTVKYMELWGVPPPPGYVEGIAGTGLNIYEFEAQERAKPNFQNSPIFQNEYENYMGDLLTGLGVI